MKDFTIKNVQARQVFDSRANPTVEVDIILGCGALGRATVPSGASTGIYEAVELRDGDLSHLAGKGVKKAAENVNRILAPALLGLDARDQANIDGLMIELDGTKNKSRLGANAILGCSMAAAHAAASALGVPLFRYLGGDSANTIPVPMIQIIGGGAHAVNSIDVQDYLVIPMSAKSFAEGLEMVVNVYNAAKKIFSVLGKPLSVADEGGLWPTGFKTNEEPLALLTDSIKMAGYRPMEDIAIALDIASSEFYNSKSKCYELKLENRVLKKEDFVDMLCGWTEKYPIISIEDGCGELDWEGFELLTARLGDKIQLIGDDIFTTNIERIAEGIKRKACNSVLIKLNQIGTITETMAAVEFTQKNGYRPVISARSGETEDSTIVHLAIASNAGQLKVGSVARGERTVKWNEAIRMEEFLGDKGYYPSGSVFR